MRHLRGVGSGLALVCAILLSNSAQLGRCSLGAYSETRSFRDALDGRSMEDAISGPVDKDTSSYGDRTSSGSSSGSSANSAASNMLNIPANGNLQQQQQTPLDPTEQQQKGGSELEREAGPIDGAMGPMDTQQQMMEQRARQMNRMQPSRSMMRSARQEQQQQSETDYAQSPADGATKGPTQGFGDEQMPNGRKKGGAGDQSMPPMNGYGKQSPASKDGDQQSQYPANDQQQQQQTMMMNGADQQQQQQSPAYESPEQQKGGQEIEREAGPIDGAMGPMDTQQQQMMEQRARQMSRMQPQNGRLMMMAGGSQRNGRQQQQQSESDYPSASPPGGATKGPVAGFGEEQMSDSGSKKGGPDQGMPMGGYGKQSPAASGDQEQQQQSQYPANDQQQPQQQQQQMMMNGGEEQQQEKSYNGGQDEMTAAKQRAMAAMLMGMNGNMKYSASGAQRQPMMSMMSNNENNYGDKSQLSMMAKMMMSMANKTSYPQQSLRQMAPPMMMGQNSYGSNKPSGGSNYANQMMANSMRAMLMGARRGEQGGMRPMRRANQRKMERKMSPAMVNAMLNNMVNMKLEQMSGQQENSRYPQQQQQQQQQRKMTPNTEQQQSGSGYGQMGTSQEKAQEPTSTMMNDYDQQQQQSPSPMGESNGRKMAQSYNDKQQPMGKQQQQQEQSYGGGSMDQQQSDYGNGQSKDDEHPPKPFAWGYDINDGYGTSQFHKENSDDYGKRTGSYGYTDAYGVYRHVNYVADENGFRATIKTNEPGTANENPADVMIMAKEPPAVTNPGNKSGYGKGGASSQEADSSSSQSPESSYGSNSNGGMKAKQSYGGGSADDKQMKYGGMSMGMNDMSATNNAAGPMMNDGEQQYRPQMSMGRMAEKQMASPASRYGGGAQSMMDGSAKGMSQYSSPGGMMNAGGSYGMPMMSSARKSYDNKQARYSPKKAEENSSMSPMPISQMMQGEDSSSTQQGQDNSQQYSEPSNGGMMTGSPMAGMSMGGQQYESDSNMAQQYKAASMGAGQQQYGGSMMDGTSTYSSTRMQAASSMPMYGGAGQRKGANKQQADSSSSDMTPVGYANKQQAGGAGSMDYQKSPKSMADLVKRY